MSFLDPVLNPVLMPVIKLSPFLAIVVLALVLSILITLAYKYFTNQAEMKKLKDQQKEHQNKMKELRSQPEEMMKVQKEAMKANLDYMKHSFKPTLITMLPILLIFGWMSAHLTYEPLLPGEAFGITAEFKEGIIGPAELIVPEGVKLQPQAEQEINAGKATWNLKSPAGTFFVTLKKGELEQIKKIMVAEELKYEEPISIYQNSEIEKITVHHNKLRPLGREFVVPVVNWQPGWLGVYIIFSLIFSLGLRKIFKLY